MFTPDGSVPDATIVDGGPGADASPVGDAAVDATAGDAAVAACGGSSSCDPRGGGCDAGVCVLSETSPVCVPVGTEGAQAVGEPCVAPGDCKPGLACFARQGGGVCARICCPGGAECGSLERCAGVGTLVDDTPTEWWSCVPPRPCDVLYPDAVCEPLEACYIVTPGGETDCRRAGLADVGAACARQEDCDGGLFCLVNAPAPVCARICDVTATGGANACRLGEGSCLVYGHSPAGTGVCTPGMP